MPLPLAMTVEIDNEVYDPDYCGHGQSKVAYMLSSKQQHKYAGRVLKTVCPHKEDVEYDTMTLLGVLNAEISPTIMCKGVLAYGKQTRLDAWVCEHAAPLNSISNNNDSCREVKIAKIAAE